MIPIDILKQGSKKIVQYLLDLFHSPDADPLFRTKLMVIGFENVGKTTILDCLFPLEGVLATYSFGFIRQDTCFRLQGNTLTRFTNALNTSPVEKELVLENREWTVTVVTTEYCVIKLVPSKKIKEKEKGKEIELYFPDKETQEVWFTRLKRVCMNEATHGIEIQSMEIDNAIPQQYFKSMNESDNGKGKGKLEMSV